MARSRTDRLGISATLPFEFEVIAPPLDCADLVNTFFVIRTEAGRIDEMMPAYSAQLLVFVRGKAVLRPKDAPPADTATVCASAPLLAATPVTFEGPVTILGASLSALGWQALAALPADEVHTCLLQGEAVVGAEPAARLAALAAQCRDSGGGEQAVFDSIIAILREKRAALDPSHVAIVGEVMAWLASDLNPPVRALYQKVGVSQRTLQRLTRRYFGVPPLRLVKRFRAIRAAMLLANPDLPQVMRDAVIDTYYDQAHLIRDIRRYTGRTPTRLASGRMVEDTLDPDAHGEAARLLRRQGQNADEA